MAGACERQLGQKARSAVAGQIEAAPGQVHAKDLECSVCTFPALRSPVKAVPCGHLFHKTCLEEWLKGKAGAARHCPNCRRELHPGDAACAEVDRFVVCILDGMPVDCPQDCGPPGSKRMRYDKLEAHILDDCPETPLLCSSEGCGAVLPRRQMEETHLGECEHAAVACKQCLKKVKRAAVRAHEENDCTHRLVTCGYCKSQVSHSSKRAHLFECTGSAPARVVAELAQQNSALREENRKLHEENAELLGQQSKRLLQYAQAALCPECPRVVVRSAEVPRCDGEYIILPERQNSQRIWGKVDGTHWLYKTPIGFWMIAGSRSAVAEGKGLLSTTNTTKAFYPLGCTWEHALRPGAMDWGPAPGTSVEAPDFA